MPSPFDVIMLQVPPAARSEPDRTVVYLDGKSRKAVFAATLGLADRVRWGVREKLRYDLWLDRSVVLTIPPVEIPNFLTKEILPIGYRMRVWIRAENAIRSVETLYHPDKPPEMVLRQHIGDFLAGKFESQSRLSREAMATHFIANAKTWEGDLVASLMQRFGVSGEVLMDPIPGIEPAMSVAFGPMDVRPRDAPRATGLSILGDLVLVPDGVATEAPPLTEQGWTDMIRRCVERAYLDRITMREHLYDPPRVQRELLAEIERRVRPVGRTVKPDSLLVRTRSSEKLPPSEVRVTAEYEWTSKRWGRKVRFQAEARMSLEAPAEWPSGKDRDPGAWFRATIGPAIESVMHGRDFDSLEAEEDLAFLSEVAAIVKPRARAVGYDLELLIFVSENEPREALKPFAVVISPPTDGGSAGYETKRARVRAKFQIEVRMRLTTLKGHAERFRGHRGLAALKDDVRKIAGDAARRYMLNVEADDYVNKWDAWLGVGGGETAIPGRLYGELQRQIVSDLKQHFAPAEIQVALYRDLSPLEDFKTKAFGVAIAPIVVRPALRDTDYDEQESTCTLNYSISDIDPKYIVDVMATGRDTFPKHAIEEDLRQLSEAALRPLSSAALFELSYEDLTRPGASPIAQRVLAQVQRTISEKYAIVLRLDSVTRERTAEEKTTRGIKGIVVNAMETELAILRRTLASREAEHAEASRVELQNIRALEAALRKAETADTLDMGEVAARRSILAKAKEASIAGERERLGGITSLRTKALLLGGSKDSSPGPTDPGGPTSLPRYELDELP